MAVEKEGFRRATISSIPLQVDQQARIDVTLEVGAITQEISIQASAALLQTENASLGDVIQTRQVLTLPLNGRNFLQLASLTRELTAAGQRMAMGFP